MRRHWVPPGDCERVNSLIAIINVTLDQLYVTWKVVNIDCEAKTFASWTGWIWCAWLWLKSDWITRWISALDRVSIRHTEWISKCELFPSIVLCRCCITGLSEANLSGLQALIASDRVVITVVEVKCDWIWQLMGWVVVCRCESHCKSLDKWWIVSVDWQDPCGLVIACNWIWISIWGRVSHDILLTYVCVFFSQRAYFKLVLTCANLVADFSVRELWCLSSWLTDEI